MFTLIKVKIAVERYGNVKLKIMKIIISTMMYANGIFLKRWRN